MKNPQSRLSAIKLETLLNLAKAMDPYYGEWRTTEPMFFPSEYDFEEFCQFKWDVLSVWQGALNNRGKDIDTLQDYQITTIKNAWKQVTHLKEKQYRKKLLNKLTFQQRTRYQLKKLKEAEELEIERIKSLEDFYDIHGLVFLQRITQGNLHLLDYIKDNVDYMLQEGQCAQYEEFVKFIKKERYHLTFEVEAGIVRGMSNGIKIHDEISKAYKKKIKKNWDSSETVVDISIEDVTNQIMEGSILYALFDIVKQGLINNPEKYDVVLE